MRVAAVAALVAASLTHPNAPPELARSAPTVAAPAEMLGPLSGPAPTILRPPGVVVESAPLRVPPEILREEPPVTAPTPEEDAYAYAYAGAGACGGWEATVAAYFPVAAVGRACAIILRESGGDETAHNASGASGLFQIMIPLHAGRFTEHGWPLGYVFIGEYNIRVAAEMFAESGWLPWAM